MPVYALDYTTVAEVIEDVQTLTADGSPYLIATDVSISSSGTLTVEAGVAVYVAPGAGITSYGGVLRVAGSQDAPVTFASVESGDIWDGFLFYGEADTSQFEHAIIDGVGDVNVAVRANSVPMIYRHVTITSGYTAIRQENSAVIIDSCSFPYAHAHDVISIVASSTASITDTEIAGGAGPDSDAIDLENVSSAYIDNCVIRSSGDDGIDVGVFSTSVTISGTRIYECSDKGISIGQRSNTDIISCIIADSDEGITVFGGSTATIDRATLHGGDFGLFVRAGDNGFNQSEGGNATVTNTIFSGMSQSTVAVDDNSELTASYCLTSDITLNGTGNIQGSAWFLDAGRYDFRLKSVSEAIDAASPELGPDPDGSRREIGALSFVSLPVVINEINYCAVDTFDTGDWLELYNPNADTVDVSLWILMDDDDAHQFLFPDDLAFPPHSFLVITRNRDSFSQYFPDVSSLIGDIGFGFSPDGELLRILDGRSVVIDSLTYGSLAPWPTEANGTGATLALIDPAKDNADPANWSASPSLGTPGAENDFVTGVEEAYHNMPLPFALGQNYPNPFNSATTIPFSISSKGQVTLSIYTLTGQKIAVLLDRYMEPGAYHIRFTPDTLGTGWYAAVLTRDGFRQVRSLLYLK